MTWGPHGSSGLALPHDARVCLLPPRAAPMRSNGHSEAAGPRYPRPERGLITRPSAAEVGRYRRHVNDVARLLDRADGVEAAWRIVDPLLLDHPSALVYKRGSWGQAAADELIASSGGWHDPVGSDEP